MEVQRSFLRQGKGSYHTRPWMAGVSLVGLIGEAFPGRAFFLGLGSFVWWGWQMLTTTTTTIIMLTYLFAS